MAQQPRRSGRPDDPGDHDHRLQKDSHSPTRTSSNPPEPNIRFPSPQLLFDFSAAARVKLICRGFMILAPCLCPLFFIADHMF